MTVEAAVVLPLFLVFFLALGSSMEMIRLHNNIEFALFEIGNKISVYGSAVFLCEDGEEEEGENALLEEIGDFAISYAYVKQELVDYLGSEYLENSPLVGGVNGLRFGESEICNQQDRFEIIVTYRVSPIGNLPGVKGFRMANRYYGHFWNGYEIPTNVVYVAENGVVYHEDKMCTHLFLSVRQVSLREAHVSRNLQGEKYGLCEFCEKTDGEDLVYITDEGNRFHYKRDCAGLKRTIYEMSIGEAGAYEPCTRCVQER